MKIYYFAVTGDVNWTEAFTSKRKATQRRNEVVRERKGDTRYMVHRLVEESFPITAKGVLAAFEAGAAQAPN